MKILSIKHYALSIALLCCACEADNQYSSATCYFVFQASPFPTSALTRAVSGAGGDFCIVKAVMEKGVYHLKLTPNQGSFDQTDLDLTISNAVDIKSNSYYVRMGRKRGLVIGRTYSGVLCAYDLQCPNCDFNSELHWADNPQELKCEKCKRVYNIYSEYSTVKGDAGRPLEQYKRVTYYPDRGILSVQNP